MKSEAFTRVFVLTADQRHSRKSPDLVPTALAALDDPRWLLGFERTAGDEIQGLTSDAAAVVAAVLTLTRLSGWRIGLGVGAIETPLPASTRAARGSAYVAARDAVEQARSDPQQLRLLVAGVRSVGRPSYADDEGWSAETALILLRALAGRVSEAGWEAIELANEGTTNAHIAEQLGVSPSAVSQRLSRAGADEIARGARLAERLLGELGGEQ